MPEEVPKPVRQGRPWLWLVVAVVVVTLALVWWLAHRWRGPEVPSIQLQTQHLVRTLQFSARVETRSRVGMGSTIVGRVEAVKVREGDAVRAGQLLVQLEQAELSAAARQAQAALAQARAQLTNVRSNSRIGNRAQVAQAEASLTQARSDWMRHQQLVEQGFLSPATLDEKRKSLEVAQAQLQAAQAQAQAFADGGAELQGAQAQVQQAEASLAAAQARLAQAHIVAPSAGKVLVRDVEPGQIVQPGTALLQLALEGPLMIVAQVDERFLDQLREGQAASVVADAFAEQRLPARVVSIAPGVDAQRGAVEVKLALTEAAPAFLREDMTLSVAVETGRQDKALVLPLQALEGAGSVGPGQGGSVGSVLVLEDGKAIARPVQLGLRTLEAVQITGGLQVGDTVLLPPAQAGQRVRPQSPPQGLSQGASR